MDVFAMHGRRVALRDYLHQAYGHHGVPETPAELREVDQGIAEIDLLRRAIVRELLEMPKAPVKGGVKLRLTADRLHYVACEARTGLPVGVTSGNGIAGVLLPEAS